MPETVTPTPAPTAANTAVPTKSDKRAAERAEKARQAELEGYKAALSDAQADLSDAFADVKKVLSSGDTPNLTPLMAAIDNLTDAVGNITAHGARNALLPNAEAKALRDAHAELTQQFSDLRTALEFPAPGATQASLDAILANMDAAIAGAGEQAKKG